MLVSALLIFTVLGLSTSTASYRPAKRIKYTKDCDISVKDNVDKYMPLVLSVNSKNILYPSIPAGTQPSLAKKVVAVEDGKKISIACPGGHFMGDRTFTSYKAMTIACNNGNFDTPPRNTVIFTDLICSAVPKSIVTKYTDRKEIGFQIDVTGSPIIPLIRIYQTRSGFYTYHKLLNSAAYSSSIDRKSNFMEGTCKINGKSADNYYQRPSQQKAINTILALAVTSNDYVSNQKGTTKYLARGHLSPVGDFLYPSERDATNVCDNIAPQWQSINNGNWRRVEVYVRDIALNKGDLTVYTGTHQVATIKGKKLFLVSGNQLPVPKYYWKIVHDAKYKTVVFLSLNNPYEGDMSTEKSLGLFRFCKGSCGLLTGLNTADFDSLNKGLTECCQVNNQILNELGMPTITSRGLLTK